MRHITTALFALFLCFYSAPAFADYTDFACKANICDAKKNPEAEACLILQGKSFQFDYQGRCDADLSKPGTGTPQNDTSRNCASFSCSTLGLGHGSTKDKSQKMLKPSYDNGENYCFYVDNTGDYQFFIPMASLNELKRFIRKAEHHDLDRHYVNLRGGCAAGPVDLNCGGQTQMIDGPDGYITKDTYHSGDTYEEKFECVVKNPYQCGTWKPVYIRGECHADKCKPNETPEECKCRLDPDSCDPCKLHPEKCNPCETNPELNPALCRCKINPMDCGCPGAFACHGSDGGGDSGGDSGGDGGGF